MRSHALARAAEVAAYPRIGEMVLALLLLGEVALLGMVTVGMRFQLVDWRVESRDIQQVLRDLEGDRLMLRRDVAALSTGERLLQLAEEDFSLTPARPEQIARLPVELARANAWNAALARPAQAGEEPRPEFPATWGDLVERMAPAEAVVERLRSGVSSALPPADPETREAHGGTLSSEEVP